MRLKQTINKLFKLKRKYKIILKGKFNKIRYLDEKEKNCLIEKIIRKKEFVFVQRHKRELTIHLTSKTY